MKRILFTIVVLMVSNYAFAKNVEVECLEPVNKDIEATEFKVKILKEASFKSGTVFKKNDIVNMQILDIIPAKSVKRSSYIIVKPVSIEEEKLVCIDESSDNCSSEIVNIPIDDKTLQGQTTSIKVISKQDVKQNLKENWKEDLGKAGKVVAKKVVNTTLPGAEQVYVVSKGLIKPAEGQTRLQSATNNLIDDTPLKHLKKGADIDIKVGDKIFLKFYHTDIPKWRFFARGR